MHKSQQKISRFATSGATRAAKPKLSDEDYQAILEPGLSAHGMQRYRNGDPIEMCPSHLQALIDRARADPLK